LGWAGGVFRDDFFLCRVDERRVETTGMEALEPSHHGGHRWWKLDQLTDTTDVIYPRRGRSGCRLFGDCRPFSRCD
jgi:hypothetical protein